MPSLICVTVFGMAMLAVKSASVNSHSGVQISTHSHVATPAYLTMRSFTPELLEKDFHNRYVKKPSFPDRLSNSFAMVMYISLNIIMVGLVMVLYWSRGLIVIFRVTLYLLSLSTMTLSVENVFETCDFDFPKFVSALHFTSCGVMSFGILVYQRYMHGTPILIPTQKQFLGYILPISFAFAMSIATNNMALVHMGAGFVAIIGSCTPICIVLINLSMGRPFHCKLMLPVLLVCGGMAMCATGELNFSTLGFLLAFAAAALRALKSALQHELMDSRDSSRKPMAPVDLLAWMSLPALLVLLVWSILSEGTAPFARLASKEWLPITWAVGISCINAMMLNVLGLFVIKDLGALGGSITAQLKGFLTIFGGAALFGESIRYMEISGYCIIILGAYWFTRAEQEAKKQCEEKETTSSRP